MVFYECVLTTKHSTHFKALTLLLKQVSMKIVTQGGIVTSIQNHGIRQFPHVVQAKHPDYKTGQRYFEKGRYISIYYESNPTTLKAVEQVVSLNDQVLRFTHLKVRSKYDSFNLLPVKKGINY